MFVWVGALAFHPNLVKRLNMFDQVGALAVHPGWVQTDMGGKQAPLTAQVLIII